MILFIAEGTLVHVKCELNVKEKQTDSQNIGRRRGCFVVTQYLSHKNVVKIFVLNNKTTLYTNICRYYM